MLFTNPKKEKVKVRLLDPKSSFGYMWITVKPYGEVDIPQHYGEALEFIPSQKYKKPVEKEEKKEEVVEKDILKKEDKNVSKKISKMVSDKKEVKKKDVPSQDDWKRELLEINGIGKKTVKDILNVYPQRKDLVEALWEKNVDIKELPFRDDISQKLKDLVCIGD